MHQSIATIDSPEFINLQPLELNPLMSSCEIKVLYVGENRNHSYITKEVATEMSKTLRGAPIVGYYKKNKDDFSDHGNAMTIDDEGIHFECKTVPYGFVSPDAKVWFKKFNDVDDFGNSIEREYLMTTGYLWTGQFEECASVLENEGKPHSMELDESSLVGHWSTNSKNGMDFFIINDATFSKLCILGNDVEPCFEGSSITAPEVSKNFTLDDNFKNTLYSMMQDLKNFALQGGQQMENLENMSIEETVVEEPIATFEAEVTVDEVNDTPAEESVETASEVGQPTEFEKKKDDGEENSDEEDESSDEASDSNEEEDEDKKKKKEDDYKCNDDEHKKKYELLQNDYADLKNEHDLLQTQFTQLKAEYDQLVEFKATIEDEKKTTLINSFYMLSDEDKKDVIANKRQYSYDEIEAKLAVICVRKKVNFDLDDNSKNDKVVEETPILTFNIDNIGDSVPAWISAVRDHGNK